MWPPLSPATIVLQYILVVCACMMAWFVTGLFAATIALLVIGLDVLASSSHRRAFAVAACRHWLRPGRRFLPASSQDAPPSRRLRKCSRASLPLSTCPARARSSSARTQPPWPNCAIASQPPPAGSCLLKQQVLLLPDLGPPWGGGFRLNQCVYDAKSASAARGPDRVVFRTR